MSRSVEQVIERLMHFMQSIQVISLASVDDEGLPYAANLYFASDHDLTLFFLSDPHANHARHVQLQPEVAVTGFTTAKMWQQVRGVQIRGRCQRLSGNQRDAAWEIYLAKFPHMQEVEQMARDCDFYRITPWWIRWSDNSVRFGYKVEMDWPDGAPREGEPGTSFL
ncbi:MAG: pyridoxamine 5'-phosphate oxidase family protein [Phycisphaeraceae bacterium]